MKELTNHSAYELVKEFEEKGLVLDYVILQGEDKYIHNLEAHKKAAITAMKLINERVSGIEITYDETKLFAEESSYNHLFARLGDPCSLIKSEKDGHWKTTNYAAYANAFLQPPYGSTLTEEDFDKMNSVLFSDKMALDICRWNTEWSNYFDEGLEWWGAYYWTVYDPKGKYFVVIGASATD